MGNKLSYSPGQNLSGMSIQELQEFEFYGSSPERHIRKQAMAILENKLLEEVARRQAILDSYDWLTKEQKDAIIITTEYIEIGGVKIQLFDAPKTGSPMHDYFRRKEVGVQENDWKKILQAIEPIGKGGKLYKESALLLLEVVGLNERGHYPTTAIKTGRSGDHHADSERVIVFEITTDGDYPRTSLGALQFPKGGEQSRLKAA